MSVNPLREFVAFDLETTGLERDTDEIIEIGAARVRDGAIEARLSLLLKADKPLTALVESLTGISKDMLAGAGEPKSALQEFLAFAGALPLVAHNADFDSAFLEHALARFGMPPLANTVYDSLLMARIAWPTFESHRLESLVEKLGIPPQPAHRALPDAEQAAHLWLKAEGKLASYPPSVLASLRETLEAGPAHWRERFAAPEAAEAAAVSQAAAHPSEPPVFPGASDPEARGQTSPSATAQASAPSTGTNAPASSPADGPVETWFSSGRIAQAFAAAGRPYQARAKQARLASLTERALRESRILVADTEPGTGRLLAALIPAVRHAQAKRRPVLLAVSGRKRAERIVTSELPLLEAALGGPVRVEMLKAPSAYPSPRKLAGLMAHPETRLDKDERLALLPLLTWLHGTRSGDIHENMGFNHERNRLLWSKLASDSYAAEPGSFAHAARERAAKAHVVLISHDLFLDDFVLDFALLPSYEAIVFDEAHKLPEAGQTRLGREVSFFRLKHILQMIAHSKSSPWGLLAELERGAGVAIAAGGAEKNSETVTQNEAEGKSETAAQDESAPEGTTAEDQTGGTAAAQTDLQRLRRIVFEPEKQLQKFFNKIAKHAQKRRKDGESRIRYADKLVMEFNGGPEAVIASVAELQALLAALAETREDLAPDLRKTADLLRAFKSDLEHLAHPSSSGAGEVFWIEDFPNPHRALIRCAPLSIGPALAERFYPQAEAAVFLSPAAAIGDQFQFFCRQLGLEGSERCKTALIKSAPAKPATAGPGVESGKPGSPSDADDRPDPIFIAKFAPVLSNQNALQAAVQLMLRGLTRFPRPALALFTHVGMLKQARALMQEGLAPFNRMAVAQHVDGNRENLLHLFRHRAGTLLLGTEAFVDTLSGSDAVPEIVLVTKLPFPVPNEPLVAPHLEKLQESGQNPLYDYLLPTSVLRLKQELSRLPRKGRTAIWILDPRLATEKYARLYQRGLGREAVVCDSEDDLFARTEAWLGSGEIQKPQTAAQSQSAQA